MGFDGVRHGSQGTSNIYGGVQTMSLSVFELAIPETTDLRFLESLYDPEVFSWFGLTMLLLAETGYVYVSNDGRILARATDVCLI